MTTDDPTRPSDLVAFLRAWLDEDEAVARACDMWPAPWSMRPNGYSQTVRSSNPGVSSVAVCQWSKTARHIARWDPARVLAEVAAKRAIIDDHPHTSDVLTAYGPGAEDPQPIGCGTCHDWDGLTMGMGWCLTLRSLAAPYADRPGFDPAWGTA